MNQLPWSENEIILSYERNFDVLEAARREYAESVRAYLESLNNRLSHRFGLLAVDGSVKFQHTLEGAGSASQLVTSLVCADRPTGFSLIVRAAVPWGGSAGHVQIAAAYVQDNSSTLISFDEVARDLSTVGEITSKGRSESGWLCWSEAHVGSEESVVSQLLAFGSRLLPIAARIGIEVSFTAQTKQILEHIAATLRRLPEFGSGLVKSVGGPWEGIYFIEWQPADLPHFWIGYHLKSGSLMYGHFDDRTDPTFSDRFYEVCRATGLKRHGPHPSGTILNRESLRVITPEELLDLGVRFFKTYREFCLHHAKIPVAQSDLSEQSTLP